MTPPLARVATRGTLLRAVALTLVTQMLCAMSLLAPAVIAPAAALDIGVAPERIGVFVALVYCVAMVSGLTGAATIARFGAIGTCQVALAAACIGLLVGASGWVVMIIVSALVLGLGYGLVNPASSHLLAKVTPPRHLALILSIKQTGVPIGGVLAGAIMPGLTLAYGWQIAIGALAVVCLVMLALCEVARRALDVGDRTDDPRKRAVNFSSIASPVKLVWATPALLDLALASMAYSGMQLILFTYLTAYLNLELGYSLIAAGLVYSATQLAGMGGRVFWGALSDRLRRPRRLLGVLGILTFAQALVLTFAAPHWSVGMLTVWCVVLGATAIGWNGVHFAEVARCAPAGQVGFATGGTQFFTFVGALAGPALAGVIVSITGRYSIGLILFGIAPLLMGVRLLLRER